MDKIIMATYAGSHLYGLNTPESDVDIRGVCLNPIESLLGLTGFEQYQPGKNEAQQFSVDNFGVASGDLVIYSLNKFFKLCLDANPNILELLFSKSLVKSTPTWTYILEHRSIFLSTKIIYTFAGYAYSQLQRIEGHKKWLTNPPLKPNPYDYGMINKEDGGQDWSSSNRKNNYENKLKEYQDYQAWFDNRNPYRHDLELKYGYDTKHAAHLFRLLIEAQELLLYGNLTLPLKSEHQKFLFNVKNGQLEYETVVKSGKEAKDKLLALESKSVLSKQPDRKTAEKLLIEINRENINAHLS